MSGYRVRLTGLEKPGERHHYIVHGNSYPQPAATYATREEAQARADKCPASYGAQVEPTLAALAYETLRLGDDWLELDDANDFSEESMAAAKLHDSARSLALMVLDVNGYDIESSASRQHYVDTGRYLRKGEAIES